MDMKQVLDIASRQLFMSVATTSKNRPDNSVVCFAADENCNVYFGSYSDTLKCKNIRANSLVAVTIGSLQIHGNASIVPYGTMDYMVGRKIYDCRFPQYDKMFELENNELYIIKPLIIWNYNPAFGEMHRDVIIFDQKYYDSLDVYTPHAYNKRL